MFAADFLMLCNKRHFVISVTAINVFYCIWIWDTLPDNLRTSLTLLNLTERFNEVAEIINRILHLSISTYSFKILLPKKCKGL